MVINSWLSALSSQLLGNTIAKRARLKNPATAACPSFNVEALEARQLLTVVAVNDSYDATAGEILEVDAANGILSNDNLTGLQGAFQFDNTDVPLSGAALGVLVVAPDGSFTYNPGTDFASLPSGQTQNQQFSYGISDMDGSSAGTVTIVVHGVNDQTTGNGANPTGTYIEDGGAQAAGATFITVNDADAGEVLTATLTFNPAAGSLSAGNSAFSSVNGVLTIQGTQATVNDALSTLLFTPATDYNGEVVISVSVVDGGEDGANLPVTGTITLDGTPVNDAPTFTLPTLSTVTVNEDTAGVQLVPGFLTGISTGPTDESGQTLDPFDVTNDNNALFTTQPAIDALGNLTYTLAPNAFGTAVVTVTLTDNGGTANNGTDSTTQTFNIVVTSINDAPTFTKGSDQEVDEDSGFHSVTNWATNLNAGPLEADTLSFEIYDNTNAALFAVAPAIDATTGTLTYTLAPNAFGTATITVLLRDDGGTANGGVDISTLQTFTITADPINDSPSFLKGADQEVNEDAAPQSVVNWATAISAGPGETQSLTFHVVTNNDSLFAVLPAIDPLTGTLTYTLAPNANGVAQVTVTLSDDGGTINGGADTSAPQSFLISAAPVNDPPVFTLAGDQTVAEDSGTQTVANFVTSSSTGPSDESGQTLQFQLESSDPSFFSVQPAIDANGTLTYTVAADRVGSVTITVTLIDNGGIQDGGDNSTTSTFAINVTEVNDLPTFTVGSNQTSNEDAGLQTVANFISTFSPGPASESGQTVNFIVSNNNNGLFSVQPAIAADGTLTYTAAPDANGTATVTVQIHDNGGGTDTSETQTFTITVYPVNDAPVGNNSTFTLAENSAVGTAVGTVTASDIDVGDTRTFAITSGNSNGAFAIDPATGVITVVNPAALDFETQPTFNLVVTVTDGSDATGTANITVNLTNVDEPLTLSLPSAPNTFYSRHGLTVVDAAASIVDVDGPPVDYTGGTLTVQITENANSKDRLDIYGQSSGPGRISLNGKNIFYGDVQIGRVTRSSSGSSALVITFNDNVTSDAVNALLKVIAYKSTVASFPTDTRTITFTVAAADSTVLVTADQQMLTSRTPPSRAVQVSGSPIAYVSGSEPVIVAPTAIITGPANLDFDGGRLDVKINASNSQNRMGIASVGGVTLNGSDVLYNGYVVGRATISKGSVSVVFSSSDATPAAVQAVARAITFSTTASNTNLTSRVLTFKLSDVNGVTAPGVTQTVTLTP